MAMTVSPLLLGSAQSVSLSQAAVKNVHSSQNHLVVASQECNVISESVRMPSCRRRDFFHTLGVAAAISTSQLVLPERQDLAAAAGLPQEEPLKLCDASCETDLENIPTVTTESGLQYKDIKVGSGPSPPIGYQVAANYVAMVPSGKIFDSSLEKGVPYIFRVGSGQVVKGLDEGILSMKVGGKRRIYVPGSLAFPKGLPAAAGRPRVLPNSPVIFDVSLEYVPGLDFGDE